MTSVCKSRPLQTIGVILNEVKDLSLPHCEGKQILRCAQNDTFRGVQR